MTCKRDWSKNCDGTDIEFLEKIGDYIYCKYLNFVFKIHRSNWPINRLSPNNCTTPTEFYKFQVTQAHGDLYNLDKIVYTGADNNVIAGCKIHGEFSIQAKHLKTNRGCPLCGWASIGESTRSNTDEFIEKARKIHGDKYDYSKVQYSNVNGYVTVICDKHGEFKITPNNHLNSRGCKLCSFDANSAKRMLSQEEVIRRFRLKHDERYDYSMVQYNGDAHERLEILCKEHGKFMQSYANHNSGKGCPTCAKEFNPKLKSGFIKSANSKRYASLYLIKCQNETEEFYKIGITTKSVKGRFSGISQLPYKYELLHLHCSDGESVWDLEKTLHMEYREFKYVPKMKFGGMYECFSYIDLDEYVKLLSIIA